jgi:hypothetical protein
MSSGGSVLGRPGDATDNTYFFNVIENKWIQGPRLIESRIDHSCGILHWNNPDTGSMEQVVVVAGGYSAFSSYLDSVELLFLDNLDAGWVEGPILPGSALQATMVEFQGGVILIGGYGDVDSLHLYQLSSPTGKWTEMKQTLKEARSYHVSFLVPDELVNCHE